MCLVENASVSPGIYQEVLGRRRGFGGGGLGGGVLRCSHGLLTGSPQQWEMQVLKKEGAR